MASKEGTSSSRTQIQQEIRKQGEIIRQLKQEEQTDEVKNKVKRHFHWSQRSLGC